jgi:hypothetical protein
MDHGMPIRLYVAAPNSFRACPRAAVRNDFFFVSMLMSTHVRSKRNTCLRRRRSGLHLHGHGLLARFVYPTQRSKQRFFKTGRNYTISFFWIIGVNYTYKDILKKEQ